MPRDRGQPAQNQVGAAFPWLVPTNRRNLLKAGSLSLSAAALPALFRPQAAYAAAEPPPAANGKARSVIFLWMGGGVTHIDSFDPKPEARLALASNGRVNVVDDLEALTHALSPPRIVWLMVPAGEQTEETIAALAPRLHAEDVIVDGGNAFYKDSVRRAVELASYGVRFVDCGVSGGVSGLEDGYALMFGGLLAASRAASRRRGRDGI